MPDGLFSPDSVTRRIYSQTPVVLGWPRAILMQIAHPLVAAGVAQHSSYRKQPVQRFLHTFDAALQIIFGSREDAVRSADNINAIHERVRGELPESIGSWPAGTPYRAGDADLLRWVHCTLLDSDVLAIERFVGPMSGREKELCYEERKAPAALLGLKDHDLPSSFTEMRRYLSDEIDSDRIAISDLQRELAGALLYPAIKGVPKISFAPLAALTAELLPEKLRAGYRLQMTPSRRAASVILPPVLRHTWPLMPRGIRCFPLARAEAVLRAGSSKVAAA